MLLQKIQRKLDFHISKFKVDLFSKYISLSLKVMSSFQNFFLTHENVFNNLDQPDEDVVIAVKNMGWQF